MRTGSTPSGASRPRSSGLVAGVAAVVALLVTFSVSSCGAEELIDNEATLSVLDANVGDTVKGPVLSRVVYRAMVTAGSGRLATTLDSNTSTGEFKANAQGAFDQAFAGEEGAEDTVRRINEVAYIRGLNGDPGRWVRADPTASDAGSKAYGQLMATVLGPERLFALLDAAAATATEVGAQTRTFRSTVDEAEILNAVPGLGEPIPPRPTTVTLVIGEDGLPVTLTTKNAVGESRTTFSHWGDPVTIEAPPADLVDPLG